MCIYETCKSFILDTYNDWMLRIKKIFRWYFVSLCDEPYSDELLRQVYLDPDVEIKIRKITKRIKDLKEVSADRDVIRDERVGLSTHKEIMNNLDLCSTYNKRIAAGKVQGLKQVADLSGTPNMHPIVKDFLNRTEVAIKEISSTED